MDKVGTNPGLPLQEQWYHVLKISHTISQYLNIFPGFLVYKTVTFQ